MQIGITSNNFITLPFEQRLVKFLDAGFNSIMIWIGEDAKETPYERTKLAQSYNMHVENYHASVDNLNEIWLNDSIGDNTINTFFCEIDSAATLGVKTVVMHLTHGYNPPPVSKIGLDRMEKVIEFANKAGVRLAFENVITRDHVKYMLDNYVVDNVGLCYDIGHDNIWHVNNWLDDYNNRIFAMHLHDNDLAHDIHLIPFDGMIDWDKHLSKLKESSYRGAITLETKDIAIKYQDLSPEEYLKRAYNAGKRIYQSIR